jgi:dihydrofolate reductase
MTLSIIVAVAKNNEIGRENNLLWRLPAELKRFKELTTGHAVVMGRTTFESLPKGALPNRRNIVLSRNENVNYDNCEVYSSLDAALIKLINEKEVFIIGGKQIYEQAFPITDKLYLTKVHAEFPEADTFFPSVDWSEWRETSRETRPADEKNPYSFTFYEFERV